MAGRFFSVLVGGGRLPIRHGVGGFATKFIHSLRFSFGVVWLFAVFAFLCGLFFFLLFLRSLSHFGSKHHPLVALLKARCATHPRLPRPKFRWRQRRAKRGWRALLRRMNQLVSREATTAPLRLPQTRRPPQRRRRPWRRAARRTSPKWRCGRSAPTARPSSRRKGRGEGGAVTGYSRCQTAPRRFSRIHTGERRQNTRHDKEEKTSRSLGAPHHHPLHVPLTRRARA